MSSENVEIVRRLFEATARDDRETVFALYDPEIEWDTSRAALGLLIEGGIFHGHEGVRRFLRKYNEAWEQMDYEIDELIDAGDQVGSVVNNRGRGRVSGVEVASAPAEGVLAIEPLIRLTLRRGMRAPDGIGTPTGGPAR